MEMLKLPLQSIEKGVKRLRKMKKLDCIYYVRSENKLIVFLRQSGGDSLLKSTKEYISEGGCLQY